MYKEFTVAAAAILLLAANGPADPAATAFGARESVISIKLSPNGERLAYVAPMRGQASGLYTVDLATGASQLATAVDGDRQRLDYCNWVSNARLVCTVFSLVKHNHDILPVSRLVAIDHDGKNVRVLGERESLYRKYADLWGGGVIDWLPDEDNAILLGRQFSPELRQKTRIEKRDDGYGVERVDTRSGAARRAEAPRLHAAEFISDGRGQVRIMGMRPPQGETGMTGRTIHYSFRRAGAKDWQPLGTYDAVGETGFNPLAVDSQLDVAYGLEKTNGRHALYRVALDGSGRKDLVFAHPEVDVDGIVRIGRRGRVVGVRYSTETSKAIYFDAELKALADGLSKALPGLPLIHFADSTVDEQKLLIWAGSDKDPGRYFVYDKPTRQLSEIMLARPQLEKVTLASVKPVTYRAADGTMVPAYLTLPPRSASAKGLPAIVMPHGGPSARDHWGFDWLAQYFAYRGYAVLQPNFRGSAGYGDAWFRNQGFQNWRVAISDVADAGRWLVSEGIADPSKLAIMGWSYGGYAALQASTTAPDLFKAAVAIAPVTDLALLKEQHRNWSNFALVRDFIGEGPHVREGSPAQNAAAIRVPVMMFHGDMDRNVDLRQSRLMADRLKGAGKAAELIVYPGLDHALEDGDARADMLRRTDAFLKAALGL